MKKEKITGRKLKTDVTHKDKHTHTFQWTDFTVWPRRMIFKVRMECFLLVFTHFVHF